MAGIQSSKAQVFIVYAHNPEEYTQLQPPTREELENEEIKTRFLVKARLHETKKIEGIRQHEKLVKTFATFLESNGVVAVLDQHIGDEGTDNRMKWTQAKIEDSKFVILVITKSFLPFLEGKPRPPAYEEYIFSNDYLYNKIHFPGDNGPKFLPVFLNQKKDVNMLPKALMASSVYEIHENEISGITLDQAKCSEDLLSLYCRITGQSRYNRPNPPSEPLVLTPSSRRPFGPKQGMTQQQQAKFECLSKVSSRLSDMVCSKLSENEAFSKYWHDIGTKLGLSPAQLAQWAGEMGRDASEQCIQMFEMVVRNGGDGLSVGRLAEAVRQTEQYQLFEIIQMYLDK